MIKKIEHNFKHDAMFSGVILKGIVIKFPSITIRPLTSSQLRAICKVRKALKPKSWSKQPYVTNKLMNALI